MTVLGHFSPPELRGTELIPLIGPAYAAVACYDVLLHRIPNPNVLRSRLWITDAIIVIRKSICRAWMCHKSRNKWRVA